MSERFKYSLNGVYRSKNFAQHLANNSFTPKPIGSAGGFDDWFINLRIDSNNDMLIYPWIYFNTVDRQLGIKCLFRVIKKDGSRPFLFTISEQLDTDEGPFGLKMNIFELLDEKNGYLDNGTLKIEYGIQVESILGKDKIWRFNTKDPLFDCVEKENMIRFPGAHMDRIDFYAHKQLLTFHSSYFYKKCMLLSGNLWKRKIISEFNMRDIENVLQIAQGVQLKLSKNHLTKIMVFGFEYSMHNVIRYCERQLIENDLEWRQMNNWVCYWHESRHYLKHFLKSVKSPREMIDEDDIGKMRGEAMKMFVAKFLYDKF